MSAPLAVFVLSAYGFGCDAPNRVTKAGVTPVDGWTVAADPRVLPMGSIIHVEGLGERMVQDVGSAIRGRRLDLFMDSCRAALEWGLKKRRVRVLHQPRQAKR